MRVGRAMERGASVLPVLLCGAVALGANLFAAGTAAAYDGDRTWMRFGAARPSAAPVQDQAYAAYRSTVLTALEDVENALTNFASQRQRLQSLQTAAEAAGRADALARQNYQAGLADFQTVLDAQRSRLSLEDSQISCEADLVTALVQLYKALGGGWTAPDAAPSKTSASTATGNPS